VLCDLLEKEHAKDPSNVKIVKYHHAEHAKQWMTYVTEDGQCVVNPRDLMRNWFYWNLTSYADVIVKVQPGTIKAVITKGQGARPPAWLAYFQYSVIVGISVWLISRIEHWASPDYTNG